MGLILKMIIHPMIINMDPLSHPGLFVNIILKIIPIIARLHTTHKIISPDLFGTRIAHAGVYVPAIRINIEI